MTEDGRSDRATPAEAETPFGGFRRRTLETFASLVLATLVSAAYAILTARALGPGGKGVVTVLLLLPAVASILLAGTLELANAYYGASRPETRRRLLGNSLVVSALGGAAAFLLVLLVGAVATRFGGTWLELVLAAATIPLVSATRLVAVLILSTGRTGTYNLLTPLGQVLLLGLTLVAFAVWGSSPLAVVGANAIAQVLAFAVALGAVRIAPALPSGDLLRQCVRYGIFGFSANLVHFLNLRLDFFLVSVIRSPAAVGVYSVAVTIAELLGRIPTAAATILLPRVASGAPGGVDFTTRVARIVLLATTAGGLVLAAVGSYLITFFFGQDVLGCLHAAPPAAARNGPARARERAHVRPRGSRGAGGAPLRVARRARADRGARPRAHPRLRRVRGRACEHDRVRRWDGLHRRGLLAASRDARRRAPAASPRRLPPAGRRGAARVKHEPLVSVVTPSLNHGAFLGEAIESVLGQDHPSVEHLVVDGGSTDGTAAVLERYQGRLRVIEEQPRRGQAHAVNLGLRAARGEILGWLNADDRYCPGAIGAAVRALAEHPRAEIVYSNWEEIDEAGRVVAARRSGPYGRREQLEGVNTVPQPTVFMRRSILDRIGYLDESLHFVMDYEFWLRASLERELVWVDETWAQFRLHPGSKSSRWLDFYPERRRVARAYGGPFLSRSFRDRYLNVAFVKEVGGRGLRRVGLR